ncbi:non-canonical purine NTP pyrophosphatase, RdgB/HAM1 family [Arcobacter sp. CECT 8989]|uniref:RdgB/HAM1 family non-canonical purine NTP pyrophosphatase n=1 Tax=Arcobacter sp. CECT 8989 TaxID=2044509 RepID=UPI00100B077D|nr:RdgB/HAM1 family non-canonical purine NTP pyrophosphatase [Arcobacter sp. CECT 8989]RXJ98011.1 non-canonical purine NTP pyrophosphatase, RdgB/HAM1 family [Arcobacter sp. CECT 8989]
MRIILATGNKGKIEEFKKLLPNEEVITFKEIIGDYEVVEDKNTFQGNALKKAQEIYEKIGDEEAIVISDDSGITVPAINNEPGIYSARYAGVNANDKENNAKLISKLNEKNLEKTPAYYTACIAIIYKGYPYTVHGWMHGEVINKELGSGGFGYDPMFIPTGFDKTLGELGYEAKKDFSHRTKALNLAKKVLDVIL